jgi:coenzyme F420-reducing hydrogenase gamma subunit
MDAVAVATLVDIGCGGCRATVGDLADWLAKT